jgi:dihydrofolate reductase
MPATITIVNNLTLDGVMQAPGGEDEDTRGGFTHGGWSRPYMDEVAGRFMAEGMASGGSMLFGRRTYEQFAGYWPHQTDGNPFTEVLNRTTKFVVSSTLTDPLPWANTVVLAGDGVGAVTDLKATHDGGLTILGSGVLCRSLLAAGLIDELVLSIHPLVLGSGAHLFPDTGATVGLELIESVPTTTGVLIGRYRPAS